MFCLVVLFFWLTSRSWFFWHLHKAMKSPPCTILWFRIRGIFSVEISESVQSWLLSQVWDIKTHNLFIFSTEKIPRILNHEMVQGGDLISYLWVQQFAVKGCPNWGSSNTIGTIVYIGWFSMNPDYRKFFNQSKILHIIV